MTTTLTEKTFAELFTYSGGTNGSRVNAQGFIEPCATPRYDFEPITKAAKGLLIENARINQLAFSSRFDNAIWVKSGALPVPGAGGAPNGRWDACKLVLGNGVGGGDGHIRQTVAKTATAITYTFSCYAKPAGSSNGWLYARGASSADYISIPFNLATLAASGVAGGGFVEVSKRVIDAGNGWRRVEIVFTTDATTNVTASIYPGTPAGGATSGDGVAGIYIWGAQLEEGKFPSSYIYNVETLTGRASIGSYYDSKGILRYAAAGAARNSYEPSNLSLPPVLMVEEQRTNILLKSSDMHLLPWNTSGNTRMPGKLAPDGTLRAVEFSGASTNPFTQQVAATATVMTYSIYVKNVSRTAPIELLLRNDTTVTNGVYGIVSLHTATPTISGAGWEMRDVGNGWFRCTYTSAFPITVGDLVRCYAVVAGARADSGACLAWGAQLEAGAYATSYIPSTETFTGRASIGAYFDSTGAMKVAASGAARMTYNPADLTIAPWLMQEGQSTNMLLESEYRNGVTGENVGPGVSTSTMTGFAGALRLQQNASTAYAYKSPALQASTTYTLSVIVEMEDGNVPPSFASASQSAANTFHLALANAALNPLAYSVQPLGGSRWRVSATATTATTVPQLFTGVWKYSTNDARSFKITAIQLEQASLVSSYIPTTTAAVTRLADAATSAATTRQADTATSVATTRAFDNVRVDTSKGWFNPAEGTVLMECEVPRMSDTGTRTVLQMSSAGNGGSMGVSYGAASVTNGGAYAYTVLGGTTLNTTPKTLPPSGTVVKLAMSYGADGARFAFDGNPINKVATALATSVTHLGIGNNAVGGNCPFFRIRTVRYQPQKLTDAEVVALTA